MMTKQELYEKIGYFSGMGNISVNTLKKQLNEFFKDKVIIQRGENRHPYADILHEWLEGNGELQWSEDGVNWYDVVPPIYQYRIKPSEPIYEWQWKYEVDDYVLKTENYYTDYEARIDFTKIEETKRERKQ